MGSPNPAADVAVVVPAFNEGAAVGTVVRDLRLRLPLVIVVDDGSADDTGVVARAAGAVVVRHALNLGQGGALSTGIAAALSVPTVRWIVTFDADGQHRPEDASAVVDTARRDNLDIALGTRFGGAEMQAGLLKRGVLRGAIWYTRATTGLPLTDTHNGLRAMSRSFSEGLNLKERGMGHASEILEHVARTHARWAEVPVQIRYSEYSRSKGQPLLNSVNIVFDSWMR